MRVSSSVVLSLLAAIGMAAPAAENGASIVARDDDEQPAQLSSGQRGQAQLPPGTVCCEVGPTKRVYSRAQIEMLVAMGCRAPPVPFMNREGIDFGTSQNEQLFEFSIGRSGFRPQGE